MSYIYPNPTNPYQNQPTNVYTNQYTSNPMHAYPPQPSYSNQYTSNPIQTPPSIYSSQSQTPSHQYSSNNYPGNQPPPLPNRTSAAYAPKPSTISYPAQHPGQVPSRSSTTTNPHSQWIASLYSQVQPNELQALQNWFSRVDTDRSGTVEVEELQHVTFDGKPIGREVAKKLVQVFDKDRNGRIDFYEYASMHKFVAHMRQAFISADADRSGRIDAHEIHQALSNAGFSYLSLGSILELLNKYDRTRLGLDWCEFLLMASHIALVRTVFQWNDEQRKGYIVLNEDQFTQISAYLLP